MISPRCRLPSSSEPAASESTASSEAASDATSDTASAEVTTVEPGKLFVMGDNRNHSTDSRDPSVGLVDERQVLGRVLLRLFPLNVFGAVE